MSRGSAPGGFEQDCLVGTKAPQHVGSMTGDDDLPANAGQRPELLDEHPEAKQLESNWSVALSPRGSAIRLENSFRQNVNPEEYTGRRRRRVSSSWTYQRAAGSGHPRSVGTGLDQMR